MLVEPALSRRAVLPALFAASVLPTLPPAARAIELEFKSAGPQGFEYAESKVGSGSPRVEGDRVTIDYVMSTTGARYGAKIDSTVDRQATALAGSNPNQVHLALTLNSLNSLNSSSLNPVRISGSAAGAVLVGARRRLDHQGARAGRRGRRRRAADAARRRPASHHTVQPDVQPGVLRSGRPKPEQSAAAGLLDGQGAGAAQQADVECGHGRWPRSHTVGPVSPLSPSHRLLRG